MPILHREPLLTVLPPSFAASALCWTPPQNLSPMRERARIYRNVGLCLSHQTIKASWEKHKLFCLPPYAQNPARRLNKFHSILIECIIPSDSCVTLAKTFNLSGPLMFHLESIREYSEPSTQAHTHNNTSNNTLTMLSFFLPLCFQFLILAFIYRTDLKSYY